MSKDRTYEPPVLVEYGPVEDLTATGSQGSGDKNNSSSGNPTG